MRKPNFKNFFKKVDKKDEKKRAVKTGIVIALIIGFISVGVGIPLGIVNNTTVFTPALGNDKTIITFQGPDGQLKMTIEELLKRASKVNENNDNAFKQADSALVRFLYEEERVASENFRAALQQASVSNFEAPKDFQVLNPLSEVIKQQQGVIDDLKLNLQQQFGFSNWTKEFQRLLREDDKYGKTGTETGALDFLVISQIRKDAFRRFQAQMVSSFTKTQLEATVRNEIKSVGDIPSLNIKKGDLIYAPNDRIFKFLVPKNKNEKLQNYVTLNERTRYFGTTSFIDKYRDASHLVTEYLNNHKNAYLISKLDLDIKADLKNLNKNWTISRKTIKQLMYFSRFGLRDSEATFRPIDKLTSFIGSQLEALPEDLNQEISEERKAQIRLDNFLLKNVSNNSDKQKSGFLIFGDIINFAQTLNPPKDNQQKYEKIHLFYSLLEDPKNANTLVVDPKITQTTATDESQSLWIKLRDELIKQFNEDGTKKVFNAVDINAVDNSNIEKSNIEIGKKIDELSDDRFNFLVTKAFNNVFTRSINNSDKKSLSFSFLNQVKNIFTIVNEDGISLVKRHLISSASDYYQYIINDLVNDLKRDRNNFNAIEIINKSRNNNINLINFWNTKNSKAETKYKELFTQLFSQEANFNVDDEIEKALQFAKLELSRANIEAQIGIASGVQNFVQKIIDNETFEQFPNNDQAIQQIKGAFEVIINSFRAKVNKEKVNNA